MEADDTNDIMAGMHRVWDEEARKLAEGAPRCHFTRMEFHMGEDESWWECRHCGHAREA